MRILLGGSPLEDRSGTEYLPIPLQTVRVDTVTGFDLYRYNPAGRSYLLYRQGSLPFTEEHRATLVANAVHSLFISRSARTAYLRYLEDNLDRILEGETLDVQESSELVYGVAMNAVEEIFTQPVVGQAVQRAGTVVRATITHLLRGPGSLAGMMDLMAADYQLYTHSVNVCVFGLALGHRLELAPHQLQNLGAGLLLHDIGKTRLDPEILAKPDPLDPAEEAAVRRHPVLGAEVLGGETRVDPDSLAIVLQHHEKCTGRGYPRGLPAEAIHPFAKIAALANTFDSLTTHRPYRRAFLSYPAIRLMQELRARDFDPAYFQAMIRMLADGEQQRQAAA